MRPPCHRIEAVRPIAWQPLGGGEIMVDSWRLGLGGPTSGDVCV